MASQTSDDGFSTHPLLEKFKSTVDLLEKKIKNGKIPKKTVKLTQHLTLMKELFEQLPPPGSKLTTQHNILLADMNECAHAITKLIGYNVKILYALINDYISTMELAQSFRDAGLPLPTEPAKPTRSRKNKRRKLDEPTLSIEESAPMDTGGSSSWGFRNEGEDEIDDDLQRMFDDFMRMDIPKDHPTQLEIHVDEQPPAAEEDHPVQLMTHVDEQPTAVEEGHLIPLVSHVDEQTLATSTSAAKEVTLTTRRDKKRRNIFRQKTFFRNSNDCSLEIKDGVADSLKDKYGEENTSSEQLNLQLLQTLESAPIVNVEQVETLFPAEVLNEPQLVNPPEEIPQVDELLPQEPDASAREEPIDELSSTYRELLIKIEEFSSETVTFLDLCPIGSERLVVAGTFEALMNLFAKNKIIITQTSPKPQDIFIALVK